MKVGKEGSIWISDCLCIYDLRNDILFNNEACIVSDLVWNIKVLAWKWSFIGEITHSKCNFYEFCKDSLYCFA